MLVWPTFCAACGQGLRREDKFCSNCGVPVPQQPFESAGTMVKPAWSEEKSTHQIVQPEGAVIALHEPRRRRTASVYGTNLEPPEPLPAHELSGGRSRRRLEEESEPAEPLRAVGKETEGAEPLPIAAERQACGGSAAR